MLYFPADTRWVSTARAFAASLARPHGYDGAEVEDLKLAVSEAVSVIIEARADRVELTLIAAGDRLRVEVSGATGDGTGWSTPEEERNRDLRLALIKGLFEDASSEDAAHLRILRFSLPLARENAEDSNVRPGVW